MKITTHPNRSRGDRPAKNPTPDEIRAARQSAGLTQSGAAELVSCTLRAWASWEDSGPNKRRMHPAVWAYFLLSTGQHKSARLIEKTDSV